MANEISSTDIGARIRQRRKDLRIQQWKLAEMIGLTQGMISNIEKGRGDFSIAKVQQIAEALNCDVSALLGVNLPGRLSRSEMVRVPIISWVAAGGFAMNFDTATFGEVSSFVELPYRHDHLFALRVKGTSCNVDIPEGSEIVVDYTDRELIDGKYFVFRLNDGAATLKRWRTAPDRLEPNSTDPRHETIFPQGEVEVIGRVVRVIKEFD